MKDTYLIVLDLDGTTLYDWETITKETVDTIEKVRQLGHKVVIATGRPYRSSKVFYDQLKLDTPIINYNGALIHHPYDEKFKQFTNVIQLDYILKVFHDIGYLIENAFCEYYENIYLYKMKEDIMPLVHPEGGTLIIGDFKETLHLNPNGFILLTYPDTYKEVEEYLAKHFKGELNFRNWGGEYQQIFEIYTPDTGKEFAVEVIAKYLNFASDQVIAFGDGDNDIKMIEQAHIGVAMENAVPELKKKATNITLSNKKNGVAHFLKHFFQL